MKSHWFVLSSLLLSGCLTNNSLQYESVSTTNLYHIALVRKGMSEKEVLRIMHKPYSYESFDVGEDIYDVWFYVTRATGLDQSRMVPQNLTPLTFKNGILVGTGYYWYYYAMKEQANDLAARNPPPPKPKTQEQEDKEFENALRPSSPAKNAPPPAPAAPNTPPKPAPLAPNSPPKQTTHAPAPQFCPDLSQITRGMTESQVFAIMGKPVRHQTLTSGSDTYDVWFYETIPSVTGAPSLIPQQTTPLLFKNAYLISKTEEAYFELRESLLQPPTPEPPQVPQKEEVSLAAEPEPALTAQTLQPMLSDVTLKTYAKAKMGMTQKEVKRLLGEPLSTESVEKGDDHFDIWFYEVAESVKKGIVEKVPLTFKNGILVGATHEFYQKTVDEAEPAGVGGYDRKAEKMQEEESEQNFDFW